MSNRFLFTTGGTVPPNDGNYIARQADDDLLELCQQGRFAYVLTARQMGKSSLMVATANTLRQQEIRPVIGIENPPDAWTRQMGINGVPVMRVTPSLPAERAGITGMQQNGRGDIVLGDVITEIDGTQIKNQDE